MALLATGVSGAPPPAAMAPVRLRSDCPDMCGDVHIPYPFGIGPDCSLGPRFRVSCSNASELFTGNIRVASITLEMAQMVALTRLTYTCNMSEARNVTVAIRLTNSPFLVSPEANIFTAIGCGSAATLLGYTGVSYLTGCISTCYDLNRTGEDGAPCTGKGCCKASLATGLSKVRVRWSRFDNPVPRNTCQYAFVARKGCLLTTYAMWSFLFFYYTVLLCVPSLFLWKGVIPATLPDPFQSNTSLAMSQKGFVGARDLESRAATKSSHSSGACEGCKSASIACNC
ncbi:hypothetical protein ACQ4PT_045857 [Festuca glaucescens]